MTRWEYWKETNATAVHLETLGKEGYELVAVVPVTTEDGEVLYFYFKRPVVQIDRSSYND